jgi:hypothetical protein
MVTTDAWRDPDGAVTTEQRVRVARPVVPGTPGGALTLALAYWAEVERSTRGLVRADAEPSGVALRLLGAGPPLLRFGPAEVAVEGATVSCRYPVEGGLLAQRPAGALTLAQTTRGATELRSTVSGFYPRLAARPGFPAWTGTLYASGQARLHDAIGRRFLARLAREAP